jgi:hypothetical protein
MVLPVPSDIPVTMVERHIWRVIYNDGSIFCEYPSPTEHHSFTEVDVDRVNHLIVEPNPWLNATGTGFVVQVPKEWFGLPVMFRTVRLNADTGETQRWHVFGTQQTIHGVNVKSLIYVSNDDPCAGVALVHNPLDLG